MSHEKESAENKISNVKDDSQQTILDDQKPHDDISYGKIVGMSSEAAFVYKLLIAENENLKLRVEELRNELTKCNLTVQAQGIELLTKNSELDLLRVQNQSLREEILLLTKEWDEYKAKERAKDRQIVLLTNELKYVKYVNAIQDANAILHMENALDEPHRSTLNSLHMDRIGDTHYIYKDKNPKNQSDSTELINVKLHSLLQHIDSPPESIRRKLKLKYHETLDEVRKILVGLNLPDSCRTLVSKDDLDALDDWWLD